MVAQDDPLAGWIPFYLKQGKVHWGYMGQERFAEPFSEETLQKLTARPFNQLFRQESTLDLLVERAQSHPGLPLQGIVFHMGRCGSTLVAQSLASLSDTVVLSEPAAVDVLLQWLIASPSLDAETSAALLQGLVSALGQARRPEDRRLFIKADTWHVCHIDRILAAFPGTPWIFLYRDPVEVMVSQSRRPGMIVMANAMIAHGLTAPEGLMNRRNEHGAWVMSRILEDAAQALQKHPGGLLVNYNELPDAMETRIAHHFALGLEETELYALRGMYPRNAKRPDQLFQADCAEKRDSATDEIREMCTRWLDGAYAELERKRKQSSSDAAIKYSQQTIK